MSHSIKTKMSKLYAELALTKLAIFPPEIIAIIVQYYKNATLRMIAKRRELLNAFIRLSTLHVGINLDRYIFSRDFDKVPLHLQVCAKVSTHYNRHTRVNNKTYLHQYNHYEKRYFNSESVFTAEMLRHMIPSVRSIVPGK